MYDAIYDIVNERAGRALEMKENEAYGVTINQNNKRHH
jgi:hypothetical protein